MNDLAEILNEIADGVGDGYHVGDRALRKGRRQRRIRHLAATALAVAVLAALAAVPLLRQSGRPEPADPTPTPSVASAPPSIPGEVKLSPTPGRASWLPSRASLGSAATTAPLPAGRAVGAAAMVWKACLSCPTILLMPDGVTYTVPAAADGALALSPDGRWLIYPAGRAQSFVLRDLAGTARREFPQSAPRAWSADSRWLVLSAPSPNQPVRVVDLSTGTVATTGLRDADGDPGVVGVATTGELLTVVSRSDSATVRWYDPGGQQVRRQWEIEAPDGYVLPVRGSLDGRSYHVTAANDVLVHLHEERADTPPWPSDLLVLDGTTGARRYRYRLPQARQGAQSDSWFVVGVSDGRVVLTHWGGPFVHEVALLDVASGQLQIVFTAEEPIGALRGAT